MIRRYILDGKTPVQVPEGTPEVARWGAWFEVAENRIIAQDRMTPKALVSTVFLGLDHDWSAKGPPLLFETMIFLGSDTPLQIRTSTWERSLAAHLYGVQKLRKIIRRRLSKRRSSYKIIRSGLVYQST